LFFYQIPTGKGDKKKKTSRVALECTESCKKGKRRETRQSQDPTQSREKMRESF